MSGPDGFKADLHRYLMRAREALVWKLDGLTEYEVRRPMVATGTNLLGLVKHVAYTEAGYLGEVFGRPFPEPNPADEPDAEPNVEMWATATESRRGDPGPLPEGVGARGCHRRGARPRHAGLGALVARRLAGECRLQTVMVHVIAETNRHAGHADIVRELLDGSAGLNPTHSNLPDVDPSWWPEYVRRLESVARQAGGLPG